MRLNRLKLSRPLTLAAALVMATASLTLLTSSANAASNAVRVTEFKTGGSGGEFVEFTNVSGSSVSMSGWSYADSSAKAGDVSLSSLGTLAPGESAILTDGTDAGFRTTWGLCASVKIKAGNTKDNLSASGDGINLYDSSNGKADSVTYSGTAETLTYRVKTGTSPNGSFASNWVASTVGDADDSLASTAGQPGSPGKSALGSGDTVCSGSTSGSITPAYAGLPAAIGDSTNPTMAVTLSSGLSSTAMTATAASSSIASAVSVSGTGTSRTVTVTPGSTEGVTTITLTAGSTTATFQYGLTRNQSNATQRWYSGVGNLSTAIDAGNGYFWGGDDESNVLHLYSADSSSGPLGSFDIGAAFGTTFAEEIDIEGSARVGNTIYWTGSMSNKNDGTESTPRSTVFATTISGTGATSTLTKTGSVYTGLRAALKSFDSANNWGLKTGFGTGTNGHDPAMANLEGMEFAPGSSTTMYLAFRGPIKSSKALIVPVTNFPSLVSGSAPTFGTPFQLNVGSGYGIREIRKNAADQYVVISGLTVPDGDGFDNAGFKLFTWDGVSTHAPVDTALTIPQAPANMTASTVGAWEAVVSMPASISGGVVRLAQDGGDTTPYGSGYGSSKDGTLSGVNALQKDLSFSFTLPSTEVPVDATAIADKSATVGIAITGFSAAATGGTSPYTFAATGLPAGITLSSAGAFSGTPTADGTFNVIVTATDSASDDGTTSFTYTVAKGAQAITFSSTAPGAAVLGGASYHVTATGGASGNPVTFTSGAASVCAVSGSTVTFVGAGTCLVRANQAAGNGYTAAPQVSQSFDVDKAAQAITFTSVAPTAAVLGGAPYHVTATGGGSGNAVTFSSGSPSVCTVSGSTVTSVHAGTCTINAGQAGDADYTAAPQESQSFDIGKAAQAITFTSTAPSAAVLGSSTYAVTATGGDLGSPVVFSTGSPTVCTVSGSTVSFIHAGVCTVEADQAGNADYSAAVRVHQSFEVGKASQAVEFTSTAPGSAIVGGASYHATATGGDSNNAVTFSSATPGVCTVSGSTVHLAGAGTCTINADQAGDDDYLAADQAQQSFAVGKGSQTVAFTSTAPNDAAVGGATYGVAATGGDSGKPVTFSSATPGVCTVSGSTVHFASAGTCTINADQAGNGVYLAAAQVQQSVAVGKGSQSITFTSTAPNDAVAGGAAYDVAATGGDSGNAVTFSSATGAICTVSGSTVTFVANGTCVINADQAGNADYRAAAQVSQSIDVGTGGGPSYAYVNENPYGQINRVAAYRVAWDGSSTLIGTFETGHPGSAGGWYAGAKGALAQTSRFLFVLNLGDQTVSTFAIDSDTGELSLVSTTPSLDGLSTGSLAVNPNGTVLYTGALSGSGELGRMNSYTIGAGGRINTTPSATVTVEANGMSVSPDGTQLAVAGPTVGVRVYGTGPDGHLTPGPSVGADGATDVRWLDASTLVVGSTEPGSVGFYALAGGQLSLIGVVDLPATPKWSQALAVGPDGTAYIGTQDGIRSATVVDGHLVLGPVAAVPMHKEDPADWITSIAVTPDGRHLLVGAYQDDAVYQFRIGADTGNGTALTYLHQLAIDEGLPTVSTYAP
jgi:6-phosphogluconolactonase (cycloisomerase 2 family)